MTRQVSVTRTIPASAPEIFALLTDPEKHPILDGSGTVRGARGGNPERLELGARFAMDMKLGAKYRITNKVVEFDQDRLIAWRHFNGHRWRWELAPNDDGTTDVTETFDWAPARIAALMDRTPIPRKNEVAIRKTLERLARHFGER
ncbi:MULTISPECIES: SRPBCC family protein [Prauserella salsuginis group]|uniref:SRPBCC family protein n=1 Tax=Prauserella salsuginis TaxID=387889 RepID=A0ABW6G2Y1_9PSEU|nr:MULTISPECIES: SRPBCC family protein [Prauserella salsuginis group]MCR3718439.1 Polyketide cyclase / dehydrase and lipid transport [Prauserella flava]MCR3733009.1 Polyketide cyclase / dehydrase and lipid transport [Prauserella salsuginis]